MFKIGMTDRLSLYIIILFYSCTIFVGYNFLDKANNQTISKTNNNKRLVHLVLMKFKKETIINILSKMRKNEKSIYLTTDLYKPNIFDL